VDILTSLAEAPKNTSDFAEEWEVETESVRYHLRQLQEGGPNGDLPGLIKCLTPGMNQYKLYGLTKKGSEMVELL
jgi:predicted ArsR family transcriptional regulator